MFRVMLPVAAVSSGWKSRWAIGAAAIRTVGAISGAAATGKVIVDAVSTIDVRIAVEVIVVVDINVVASPSASTTPPTAPESTHHHPDPERNGKPGGVIPGRRVIDGGIRIHRRTVDDDGIISGDIDDLWIGLLDNNNVFVFDNRGFHFLLFVRLQVSFILGFLPHALHSVHHVGLLCEECIPKVGRPANIVGQTFHHFGQGGKRLNAWVPGLFRNRVGQLLIFECLVLLQPLLQLDDLERICRSGQDLR